MVKCGRDCELILGLTNHGKNDGNEYWVNVVPQKICSFHAFKLKINSAPIKALCNTKEHEISISRSWFSRKNMKKPSAARAAGIEMSRA